MSDTERSRDLFTALSLAVGGIVLGSVLPWSTRGAETTGNLTLLLGGTAGALIARWWLFSREHRGLLTVSAALSAGASAVLVLDLVRLTSTASQPQSGVFVATLGALMATWLAFVMRRGALVTAFRAP